MTFNKKILSLSGRFFLRNLTGGAAWQPEFFDLNVGKVIEYSGRDSLRSAKAEGFASKVIGIFNGKFREVFFAIFFHENEWMVFDGQEVRLLGDVNIEWHRSRISLFGAGIATLKISDAVESKSISYFRPWLRHWFEDGWSIDDIDVGWVIKHLASDADAKVRLLKVLQT
jgi:hypothetical protein